MIGRFTLLLTLLFAASCSGSGVQQEDGQSAVKRRSNDRSHAISSGCEMSGSSPQQACFASIYKVITNPELFDALYISTVVYIQEHEKNVGYAGRDASLSGDFASSVLISARDEDLPAGYVRVITKFSARRTEHDAHKESTMRGQHAGVFEEIFSYAGVTNPLLPVPDRK